MCIRHPLCVSTLEDLAKWTFAEILDDSVKAPKRLILCSGRIYYDLVEEREKRGKQDEVALVRIEQLADGLFSSDGENLLFQEIALTLDDIADTEDCICKRVLRYFGRKGWFDKETIKRINSNKNNGFSKCTSPILGPRRIRTPDKILCRALARIYDGMDLGYTIAFLNQHTPARLSCNWSPWSLSIEYPDSSPTLGTIVDITMVSLLPIPHAKRSGY